MKESFQLAWEITPPNYVFEPPITGNTTVLAVGSYGHYGFWARSGALRWRRPETESRDFRPWALRTTFGPVSYGRFDDRWGVVAFGFDGATKWRVAVQGRGAVATADRQGLWLFSPRKGGSGLLRRIDRDGRTLASLDAIDEAHEMVEFGGALYLAGRLGGHDGVFRVALPGGSIGRVLAGGGASLFAHASRLIVSVFDDPWGEVRCLDEAHATRWKTSGNVTDVHRGRVLAMVPWQGARPHDARAQVASLDADSGETRWRATLDGIDALTEAVGVGPRVCVNGSSLDALDLGDGSFRQRLLEASDARRYVAPRSAWGRRIAVARGDEIFCWTLGR